ncbi:Cna B-type domain-containing protein, partial [Helcococcus ovis]|uniref:Cna B-type domain-containing protein n=2 Tax=Helcococcus ovis TaxID=72026 RepID=UPI0038BB3939
MKKIEKILQKLISLFLVFVILAGIVPLKFVYAQRDISSDVVNSLTVDSSNIQDGGKTRVRVEFAENGSLDIKDGDIITVTWTRQSDIQFSGYSQNMDLIVGENRNVGDVLVTETGATLRFNGSVNKLDDVKGFVEFEVQGRNYTQTSEKNTKNGIITSGRKSVTVSVTKPESGTISVFYYKTGSMDPNDTKHVNWWLNANCNKTHVSSDITIKDEIQSGQELEKDSFLITVTNYLNDPKEYSIEKFLKVYSGSNITINGNNIDVYIPQQWVSTNKFSIYYRTTITNFKQREFVNNSKAWYHEHGKEAVQGKDFNYSVWNTNASAGITGTVKGELKIFKKINGTEIGIPGVEFLLKNESGTVIKEEKKEFILKTEQNGTVSIKNLPVGRYIVKEISAPDWILFDPLTTQELTFEVKEEDKEGKLLEISNEVKKTELAVEKKWLGKVGDSVTVQLKTEESDDVLQEYELKKNEGWKHIFTGLRKYTVDGSLIKYKVVEKNVPQGYKVKYEQDSKGNWIIKNIQDKIKVKVIKKWEDITGNHPTIKLQLLKNGQNEGSPIELTNGMTTHTWTDLDKTDSEGRKYTYTVKEIGETGNYIQIGNDWYKVTYGGNQESELTVNNKKLLIWTPMIPPTRNIKVTKNWKLLTAEKPVDKIEVELYKDGVATGKKLELNKNNNWSGEFKNLEVANGLGNINYHKYTVKEVGEKSYAIQLVGKWYGVSYTGNMKDGFTITNKEKASWTPMIP